MRFGFGDIGVDAYVGPNKKHTVLRLKVGPPVPMNQEVRNRTSREREFEVPSPEVFPADFYTELIATQQLEIEDELAKTFFAQDTAARDEVLRLVAQKQELFGRALDFVAGVLGLRLHHLLVTTPIDEQCFAYRKKGEPYTFSTRVQWTVTDAHEWDVSAHGVAATRRRLPRLQPHWTWERAAEVLAWLLRAWAAKDSVLTFVSLFIPLECVIPPVPKKELNDWEKNQQAILALVKEHTESQIRKDLSSFVTGLRVPPPLSERFEDWAAKAALHGWANDVAAFRKFCKMRNSLVHRGQPEVEFRVTIEPDDVRTLEDIVERYVSLALFGDANVYQSKKRPARESGPSS